MKEEILSSYDEVPREAEDNSSCITIVKTDSAAPMYRNLFRAGPPTAARNLPTTPLPVVARQFILFK